MVTKGITVPLAEFRNCSRCDWRRAHGGSPLSYQSLPSSHAVDDASGTLAGRAIGPSDRRAADITAVAGEHDPREVLFGVLGVARDLLALVASSQDVEPSFVLQALAEQETDEIP